MSLTPMSTSELIEKFTSNKNIQSDHNAKCTLKYNSCEECRKRGAVIYAPKDSLFLSVKKCQCVEECDKCLGHLIRKNKSNDAEICTPHYNRKKIVDQAHVPKRFVNPRITTEECLNIEKNIQTGNNYIYHGTQEKLANYVIWRTFTQGLYTAFLNFNAMMKAVKATDGINSKPIREIVENHETVLAFTYLDKTKFSNFDIDMIEYILQTKYYAGTPSVFLKGIKERLKGEINNSLHSEIFT